MYGYFLAKYEVSMSFILAEEASIMLHNGMLFGNTTNKNLYSISLVYFVGTPHLDILS